jgi:hypothetical protein
VEFTAVAGGADPAPESFRIHQQGGTGTLAWTVSENADWLSATPTSGSGAGTVNLRAALGSRPAGTYEATVTVGASGAASRTVAVTLTVEGPGGTPPPPAPPPPPPPPSPGGGSPALGVSADELAFSATFEGVTAPQQISLTTGDPGVSWTVSSPQRWITVSPQSGRGPAVLTVTLDLEGGTAGAFEGQFRITAPAGTANSPMVVNVTLVVAPPGEPGGEPPPGGGESFDRVNVDEASPGSAGRIDGWDVMAALAGIQSGDPRYDVNGDGRVDAADVDAVLARFGSNQ